MMSVLLGMVSMGKVVVTFGNCISKISEVFCLNAWFFAGKVLGVSTVVDKVFVNIIALWPLSESVMGSNPD